MARVPSGRPPKLTLTRTDVGNSQGDRAVIAERIRSRREALGLKQLQVVRRLEGVAAANDVPVATRDSLMVMCSGWETAKKDVPDEYRRLLVEVLECAAADLGLDGSAAAPAVVGVRGLAVAGAELVTAAAAESTVAERAAALIDPQRPTGNTTEVRNQPAGFASNDPEPKPEQTYGEGR
jgi:hypothetical protein